MSDLPTGVAAIANAVANGAVSAREIVADHLERAEASQDAINAFTLLQTDSALARAGEIDELVASGTEVGPLAGVPIALKDLIDAAGVPNTAGSSYPTSIPEDSAPVVKRLESAGAVIIGRTGLHEYAFGFSSENPWFGPVRNPWNTELSPGGSSGGSAAAVATGVAAGSIGTDTGGSVRVPAALCGIFGLKVTHGRVPLTGVFPLAPSADTVGPFGRNSHDTELIYLAIAGHDPSDPWSAPQPVVAPGRIDSIAGIRFGVPHPWVDLPQTATIAASFKGVRSDLEAAGGVIVDLDLPELKPGAEIEHLAYSEVARVHNDRWHSRPETYGVDVASRLSDAFETDARLYVDAQRWRSQMRNIADAALADCDFLITPAVAANVKPIGEEEIEVGGKMVSYRPALSRYSALVNHLGLPAVSVPLAASGTPPPSVQIIGARWAEHRLLEVGAELERIGISRFRKPPENTF